MSFTMLDADLQLFMMCLQNVHLPLDPNATETPTTSPTVTGTSGTSDPWTVTLTGASDYVDDAWTDTYNDADYEQMRKIVQRVTPIICVFGSVGNILTLLIFIRRFYAGQVKHIERGAIIGLASLAASDLAFCLLIITGSLIPNHKTLFTTRWELSYVYQVYGVVVQNALMKTSTWLTTIACMSRYAAVSHPLWVRRYNRLIHIKLAVLLSFVVPFLLYIPQLWTHTVHEMRCENYTLLILTTGHFEDNTALHQSFNYVWLVLGYIVPAAIMMYCNSGLIVSFRRSMALRSQMVNMQTDAGYRNAEAVNAEAANAEAADANADANADSSDSGIHRLSRSILGNAKLIVRDGRKDRRQCSGSHANRDRITITLIAVVVLYILLISPSEILNFYSTIRIPGDDNKAYHTALLLTNVLQAINFSVNFLLYSIINVYIRQNIRSGIRALLCCLPRGTSHGRDVKGSGRGLKGTSISMKRSISWNVTAQTDISAAV